MPLSTLLATRLQRVRGEFSWIVQLADVSAPHRRWTLVERKLSIPSSPWESGLGLTPLPAGVVVLWYFLFARLPTVRRAVRDPEFLAGLTPEGLATTSLGRPVLLDEPILRSLLMQEDPLRRFLAHCEAEAGVGLVEPLEA